MNRNVFYAIHARFTTSACDFGDINISLLLIFHSRFDHEMVFELPNETSKNVPLKGKYMYFLSTECAGKNHNLSEDGCGKVEIHSYARSVCPPPQEIGTESGS